MQGRIQDLGGGGAKNSLVRLRAALRVSGEGTEGGPVARLKKNETEVLLRPAPPPTWRKDLYCNFIL